MSRKLLAFATRFGHLSIAPLEYRYEDSQVAVEKPERALTELGTCLDHLIRMSQ
jgi:hypothetical protein